MALITKKKEKEKKLYNPKIKETQNAKALSTHHGQLLKLFSLQTKSPQLSNGSTGVRERVSGDLPLILAALALVLQWPTTS